jgi:HSP20 family protein
MDRERNLMPRSLFRVPSFLPSLWEEMEDRLGQWMGGAEANTGVTVSEDDKNVYVEAHLPGLKANDIDISLNQNTLWIKGERQEEETEKDKKYYRRARNSFFYQVELPGQVEEESEQAQFQDGVLKMTFRKARQSQVRKISIKNGANQASSKNNNQSKKQ